VTSGNLPSRMQAPSMLAAFLLFGIMASAVVRSRWTAPALPAGDPKAGLYDALFNIYALPFEVASIFLLMAMIGAIVLAKDQE